MVLRQRKGKSFNKVVQDLDAFPKVPETYVEHTTSGASISIITFILVCCLLWSELKYFIDPGVVFKFEPDTDFQAKLSINIDMTVAMRCDSIGADVLDSTNQNTFSFGRLDEENTWFELDRIQRRHFEEIQMINSYLREEYHTVHDILWKTGKSRLYGDLPKRREGLDEPHDACRFHGTFHLNKVSGNFHITVGKSIPLMRGHAHLAGFIEQQDYNFSHRIDKFSFGDSHHGIIQPLEGDEKTTDINFMNYQYFIEVVPTDIQGISGLTYSTYQYSVKEQVRPIDHETGSHGTPGIYFKYDMSALKLLVHQDREPIVQFIVRLCSAIGGLVSTSYMICNFIQMGISYYCCKGESYYDMKRESSSSTISPKKIQTADLISPQERIPLNKSVDVSSNDTGEAKTYKATAVTLTDVEKLIKS